MLLPGCRIYRQASSSMDRSGSEVVGLRARGFSFLRDTLAERQIIRIEYYEPTALDCLAWEPQEGSVPPSADVGGNNPTVAGGREPSIKSIEIITESNYSSSQTSTKDSTRLSQTSTTETLQEETSSDARQDNGAWATVLSIAAVAALAYFIIKKIMP